MHKKYRMTKGTSNGVRKKITVASGLLASGLLIGLYIFQLNSLTTLAYHVAETEEQLTQIKHGNTALQHKAYQAVSLKELEQLARKHQFVKINSITYLRIVQGGVAQN